MGAYHVMLLVVPSGDVWWVIIFFFEKNFRIAKWHLNFYCKYVQESLITMCRVGAGRLCVGNMLKRYVVLFENHLKLNRSDKVVSHFGYEKPIYYGNWAIPRIVWGLGNHFNWMAATTPYVMLNNYFCLTKLLI